MRRFVTYFFFAIIISTLAGGFGGSIQPARVLLAIAAPLVFLLSVEQAKITPIARQALIMSAVFVLAGVISLSWTTDVLGGFGLLLAVTVGGLGFFIVTRCDVSYEGIRLLIWAWVTAVGLSIPIAFYEIMTGNHFQFALEDRVIGGIGEFPFASIFFGNYNDYSAWLCLAFPITMAAFFEARHLYTKAIVTAINAAAVGIVFVNTSRASLAYVAAVTIVYVVISNKFRMFAGVAVAIVVPLLFARYQGQFLDLYDLAIYRFQVVGALDDSYVQRSGLVENGIRAIIESYGIGIGIGGFEEYMNDNYPYFIPNPHNILLEIGVNFGVLPLLLFVSLLVRLFLTGWFRRDMSQGFRLSLMFGALSVPIIGAVPSQAIGYVYWWVWLATMIAIASVHSRGEQYKRDVSRQRQLAPVGRSFAQ